MKESSNYPAMKVDLEARLIKTVLARGYGAYEYLYLRIAWLRELDREIIRRKYAITAAIAADKHTREYYPLLSEYALIHAIIRYYLKRGKKILADERRSAPLSLMWGNRKAVIRKYPLGVVGVITPWNYPFSLSLGAIVPALLAGNGVLWKPAAETPQTNGIVESLLLNTLRHFGLDGLFASLPTDVEAGRALVQCPLVDKIHFTGSETAGRWIAIENSKVRFTPPTLELGGSNAALVLEDADLASAAKTIIWARFAGMSCNNIKRVYACGGAFGKLLKLLVSELKNLSLEELPFVPEKERTNYKNFLAGYNDGWDFPKSDTEMHPRILPISDPGEKLSLLEEETFVPLLPVVKVATVAYAIRLANASRFGLGASVFTKNRKRFQEIADQLECGAVLHNDGMMEFAMPQIPFGGWKASGSGYVHGPEGLLEFVQRKAVIAELWSTPQWAKFHLFPWTEKKLALMKRFIDTIINLS